MPGLFVNAARLSVALVFAFTALASTARADALDQIFATIDKAAAGFHAVKADFSRLDHTAIVDDDSTMQGTYMIRRQKGETRMLIDFTAPDRRSVSFEGSQVKVFYPKVPVVEVFNVGDKRAMIDDFLLLGFGATSAEIQRSYTVTYLGAETVLGHATVHLKLVPKSKEALQRLRQGELWIAESGSSAGFPVQQKFTTSSAGDYKLITYRTMTLMNSMSDKDLKLKTPAGVEVKQK